MKKEYSFIAKIYDPLLYFFIHSMRLNLMEIILDYKNKSILDLCCGTGNQLKLLSKNDFKNLHCLDLSSAMLKQAQKNNINIKFYKENATKTNFKDELFDLLIISFAIHEKNKSTQEDILKEAHRILKKDGALVILDYDLNEKNNLWLKATIYTIKRIARKKHYYNFKNYIKNKGLLSLVNPKKFLIIEDKQKNFKGVSISLYKKLPQ